MKKGWEYKTLKEISIIYGNYGLSVSSIPYNGVRYLRITDITENGELNDDKVSADISSGKTQEELQEGDILFARTGATVGKTLIYRKEFGKCLFAGYLIRYRLNKDIVIPQFIHHFTHSSGYYKWVSSNQKAAAQPNIGAKIYNELRIPVPPLSEQKEIVEYLDSSFAKIDKLKENAAKNLEEAKALFQSALKDALEPKEGWEEKTLKEIGITQTGTTPSKSDSANYGNYMEFIRPSEIDFNGMGGINYNCELKLSEQGASNGRVFEEKSILMVCIGATIGKVGFSNKKISCNQQINVLTPSSEYDYKFVYYSMKSPRFQKMVIKEGTSSQATLPIINKGKWEKLTVQVPSLPEQQSIVSFLDSLNEKVNTLQQNYSRICDECDALKQAILRQVFE